MSAPRKKLTRKRLNNALAQVYRERPNYFLTHPTKMSFFEHVHAGNLDDVQEFLEEEDFNINMRDKDGNNGFFYAMDGAAGLPMAKFLYEHGADINSMNYIGEVPFHVLSRDLTSISSKQLEILEWILDQDELVLFPYFGRSIETVFLQAMDDIEAFDRYMFNARVYGEERTAEEEERYRREQDIRVPLENLFEAIQGISEEHVKYVNIQPANTKERKYFHLDTRMKGEQLKQLLQRQVFLKPSMNLDLLFGGRLLDLSQSLAEQGIEDENTITFQIRLVSGILPRRGGKRKTRRGRN